MLLDGFHSTPDHGYLGEDPSLKILIKFDTSGSAVLTRRSAHFNSVDGQVGYERDTAPSLPDLFRGRRNLIARYTNPQAGKPQQNPYIERYNRTVRGEWLGLDYRGCYRL